MNKIYALAAAVAALFVYGCGGGGSDTGGGTGPSLLRVVNAAPDAGTIDVEVRSASFGTVAYGGSQPASGQAASSVANGPAVFDFFETGTSNALLNDSQTLVGGHLSTEIVAGLTAGGEANALRTIFVDDNRSQLDPAKAYARVVNASPRLGAVDVYITAPGASITGISPTISSLNRYAVSNLISLPLGAVEVRVCPAGSKTPTIDTEGTVTASDYTVAVLENDSEGGVELKTY